MGQPPPDPPRQADTADADGIDLDDATTQAIVERVRATTGVDLGPYRDSLVTRCLTRRMEALDLPDLAAYRDHLASSATEAQRLLDALPNPVTRFFRDPDVFDALEDALDTVPVPEHRPLRAWVPACCTGEEAYSLAIVIAEHLEARDQPPRFKVYATDVSRRATEQARKGLYPPSVAEQIPDRRLARWFTPEGDRYRVDDVLRERCVFAQQDLLAGATIPQVDLVSCRNLLIYLAPRAQHEVLGQLHGALSEDGLLVLGQGESPTPESNRFTSVDRRHRIYRRRERTGTDQAAAHAPRPGTATRAPERVSDPEASPLQQAADRVALSLFAPARLVVDADLEVLLFEGPIGAFLALGDELTTREMARIAPRELVDAVETLVEDATREGSAVLREDVTYEAEGQVHRVDVRAQPLSVEEAAPRSAFLVTLTPHAPGKGDRQPLGTRQDAPARPLHQDATDEAAGGLGAEAEVADEGLREQLRSIVAEHEVRLEELRGYLRDAADRTDRAQAAADAAEQTAEDLRRDKQTLRDRNAALRGDRDDPDAATTAAGLLDAIDLALVLVDDASELAYASPAARTLLDLGGAEVVDAADETDEAHDAGGADGGAPLDLATLPLDPDALEDLVERARATQAPTRARLDLRGSPVIVQAHPHADDEPLGPGVSLVFLEADET